MDARTGRVLVGYDASEHARRAVLWAADEAARRGDCLVVVHAADYRGLGLRGPAVLVRAWARAAREEAREIAAEGATIARLAVPELVVDTVCGVGAPVPLLVEQSRDADLLVLGAHGQGREAPEILGPIVDPVAGLAFCPVLVIDGGEKARPGPERPVVVGVDGSAVALQAVDFAAVAAEAARARLRIVSAWSRPRPVPSTTVVEFSERTAGPSQAAARAAVAEAVARTRAAHRAVEVHGSAFPGEATRVLVDQATGAGLLVVGRRATPRPPAALGPVLGSVGRRMVRTCPCPVMFVGPAATSLPSQRGDEHRDERKDPHRALRGTPLGSRW